MMTGKLRIKLKNYLNRKRNSMEYKVKIKDSGIWVIIIILFLIGLTLNSIDQGIKSVGYQLKNINQTLEENNCK